MKIQSNETKSAHKMQRIHQIIYEGSGENIYMLFLTIILRWRLDFQERAIVVVTQSSNL